MLYCNILYIILHFNMLYYIVICYTICLVIFNLCLISENVMRFLNLRCHYVASLGYIVPNTYSCSFKYLS